MRPIKLQMRGFQGFKNATEVDFSKLYEDSIFLITGPTGAGKTSIFDAVCYALYGEGSGKDRKDAGVYRSHLLEEDEKMEVRLSFSVRGEIFHVQREESAKKVKKVAFYSERNPEKVWTKINDVRQEIELLIGLNHEQFKKIVMIPQGEFREFLAASTKEKSEILKKLFSTEIYSELQGVLKEMHDAAKQQNAEHMRRFSEILKDSGVPDQDIVLGAGALEMKLQEEQDVLDATTTQFKEAEAEVVKRREDLTQARTQNEELAEFQRIKKAFHALEDRKLSMGREEAELVVLKRVRGVLPKEEALRVVEADLALLGAQAKDLAQKEMKATDVRRERLRQFEVLDKQVDALDEKKRRRDHLEELVAQSKRYQELKESIREKQQEEGHLRSEVEGLRRKRKDLDTLREKEGAEQLRLSKMEHMNLDLAHRIEEKSRVRILLQELYRDHSTVEEKEKGLKQLQLDLGRTRRTLEQQEHALVHEQEKQRKNMAGVLRSQLKEGLPCPVCGSTHHPGGSEGHLDFDEAVLQKLESNVKRLASELATREADLHHGVRQLEELRQRIQDRKLAEGVAAETKEMVQRLGTGSRDILIQLEREKKRNEEGMEELGQQLDQLQKEVALLKEALAGDEALGQRLEEVQAALGRDAAEAKMLKERGVLSDGELHRRELEHLDRLIRETIDSHKEARRASDAAKEELTALQARTASLHEQQERRKTALKEARSAFEEALRAAEITEERFQVKRNAVREIEEREAQLLAFREHYQQHKGAYESRRSRGETLRELPLEELEQTLQRAEDVAVELAAAKEEHSFKVRNLQQAHQRAKVLLDAYGKDKLRFEELQDLYNTAYLGMNFETFVQSYYFEGILLRANERLHKMTEGRYQLRRRNESESRREKVGLGLNIFDEYSGKERDVLSLSGGESFKASLALALGLSEFIESTRGAVNLETIFIDEGFGSLDQDSLDNAMESLMELNYRGRFVGIISHVSELKERILRKIEVTSTPGSGSSVAIR